MKGRGAGNNERVFRGLGMLGWVAEQSRHDMTGYRMGSGLRRGPAAACTLLPGLCGRSGTEQGDGRRVQGLPPPIFLPPYEDCAGPVEPVLFSIAPTHANQHSPLICANHSEL